MAGVNISLSQDQFICSLCLEILKAPVTIPCGHNYCMSCIEVKWDQSEVYSCPQCAEHFDLKPVLHQNAILVDIVEALKAVRLISTSLENFAGPEEIPCDVCPTKKQKAILTCLTCLASFCEMHFQPHRKSEALKKHKVEKPTRNLEHKMCSKHEKFLEVFLEEIRDAIDIIKVNAEDACDLTLDPNTANIFLTLSEGNRKVTYDGAESQYPDHPNRFDYWEQVLCAQALTGTRSYWEVEWNGREVEIGVTYKGICRKGEDDECRIGDNDMSWCLWCSDYGYSVCHNYTATVISESYSPRIGVYLDIPSGLLSFYSISDTMTLLYTFKASFTEPLYPGFWVEFESSVFHTSHSGCLCTITLLSSCDDKDDNKNAPNKHKSKPVLHVF
uniref:Uncharacterized protein n=1 Tax=Erpetoichthys calabaricus TaxID=27687 RepID=A0A8C4RMM4_ERPCA